MIQSSLQTAEDVAKNMGHAADEIQRAVSGTIVKAERTTVTVNAKAQEANEEAVRLAQLFLKSFQESINNIHLVANEFQRTDKDLGGAINELLRFSDELDNWMTYLKAKNG